MVQRSQQFLRLLLVSNAQSSLIQKFYCYCPTIVTKYSLVTCKFNCHSNQYISKLSLPQPIRSTVEYLCPLVTCTWVSQSGAVRIPQKHCRSLAMASASNCYIVVYLSIRCFHEGVPLQQLYEGHLSFKQSQPYSNTDARTKTKGHVTHLRSLGSFFSCEPEGVHGIYVSCISVVSS